MRALGIDPGTVVLGYGVVEKGAAGSLIHVSSGEIRMPASLSLEKKLLRISDSLTKIIEEYSPDCAAIESVFFARNVRSALLLGHARGVAMLVAAKKGLNVYEYSPKKIKESVTGCGGAAKEQVQKMVSILLKHAPRIHGKEASFGLDASDALAAAICHIHHAGYLSLKNRLALQGVPDAKAGRL